MDEFNKIYTAVLHLNSNEPLITQQNLDYIENQFPFLTPAGKLAAENQHEAVEFLRQHGADVKYIMQGYALAGNHEKGEEYRTAYPEVHDDYIARGYAQAGNHQKVEEYLTTHKANASFIARAYAQSGNHQKVEEYRTTHKADASSIAQAYAQSGNHQKKEEYQFIEAQESITWEINTLRTSENSFFPWDNTAAIKTLGSLLNFLSQPNYSKQTIHDRIILWEKTLPSGTSIPNAVREIQSRFGTVTLPGVSAVEKLDAPQKAPSPTTITTTHLEKPSASSDEARIEHSESEDLDPPKSTGGIRKRR